MTLTFFLAVIGWIIFRAENMTQAVDFLTAMFTNQSFDMSNLHGVTYTIWGLSLLLVEWLQRNKQHALQFPNSRPLYYRVMRWCIYYMIIYIIIKHAGTSQTFIYFQF